MNRSGHLKRILYITKFSPNHTTLGSELRARHVLRALQQLGEVRVMLLQEKEEQRNGSASKTATDAICDVEVLNIQVLTKKSLWQKAQWFLNPSSSYPHGCYLAPADRDKVLQAAKEADLIWFFKLESPNLFPNGPWARSVVDIDDVPSTYLRAQSANASSLQNRIMTLMRLYSWKRRESLLHKRFDVLAVCSKGDRDYLRKLGVTGSTHIIPNGFEQPTSKLTRRPATPPRIGFTGLFDYRPNVEGIHWFVRECWPRIKQRIPDVRLRLAGRSSDGPLKPVGPDVEALGWVDDLDAEMATWSLMVVPILVGAGTRVKIALGFSRQCPMVSTSLGAYGYEIEHGKELLLADSAEDFANACVRLIERPVEAAEMAERAHQTFLENWTWEAINPRVWAAARECLDKSASTAQPAHY